MTRSALVFWFVSWALVALFILGFTAAGRAENAHCEDFQPVQEWYDERGYSTTPVQGVAFDVFMGRIIKQFGMPPFGEVPSAGMVVTHPDLSLVIVVIRNKQGQACGSFRTVGRLAQTALQLIGDPV